MKKRFFETLRFVSTNREQSTRMVPWSQKTSAICIAFLSVFVDMLGLSIVLPVLPYLALRFDASGKEIGYLFSIYAGCQMISIPVSGKLSDKFGRRPLLLVSLLGSCIGFLVQGWSPTFAALLIGRAIAGVFGGSIPIAQSTVADLVDLPSERAKYFAIQGIVLSVAFMFGPGIGAGLALFSLRTPMLVSAGLAGFGFLLCLFYFPAHKNLTSSKGDKDVERNEEKEDNSMQLQNKARNRRCVLLILASSFMSMLSFAAFLYFSGLLLYKRFGWGPLEYGFVSMASATLSVLVQAIPYVKLVQNLGKHGTAILGAILQAVGMLGIAAVDGEVGKVRGLPLFALSVAFLSAGFAILMPSLTAALSRHATATKQGFVLGISQGLQAAARVVGPLVYGVSFDSNASLPYIVAAAASVVCACLLFVALRTTIDDAKEYSDKTAGHAAILPEIFPDDFVADDELISELQKENDRLRQQLAQQTISPIRESNSSFTHSFSQQAVARVDVTAPCQTA